MIRHQNVNQSLICEIIKLGEKGELVMSNGRSAQCGQKCTSCHCWYSVNSEIPNGIFLELYSSVAKAVPTENI